MFVVKHLSSLHCFRKKSSGYTFAWKAKENYTFTFPRPAKKMFRPSAEKKSYLLEKCCDILGLLTPLLPQTMIV